MRFITMVTTFFLAATLSTAVASKGNPFEELMQAMMKQEQSAPHNPPPSAATPHKAPTHHIDGTNQQETEIVKCATALPAIAENLNKFLQSTELKAIVDEQRATQKKQEEIAEQFQKRMVSSSTRSYWNPSSSKPWQPYRPPQYSPWSSAGASDYGSLGSWSPRGSAASYTPSTQSLSNFGKDSTQKPLSSSPASSSTSTTDQDKSKGGVSTNISARGKRTYHDYADAALAARDIAQTYLAAMADQQDEKAKAAALLTTLTPELQSQLSDVSRKRSHYESRSEGERTVLEQENKNKLKTATDQLHAALQTLAPHLLYAATLDELDGIPAATIDRQAQGTAKQLWQSPQIKPLIPKDAIDRRAKDLLDKAQTMYQQAVAAAVGKAPVPAAAAAPPAPVAPPAPPAPAPVATPEKVAYKANLQRIIGRFPQIPASLQQKLASLPPNP